MSAGNPPTREATKPPTAKDTRTTYWVALFLLLVGAAAAGSWLLGPNALGEESTSPTGQERVFYFKLFGPIGIPLGLYFLYLGRAGSKRSQAMSAGTKVTGSVTHLWKVKDEPPERRYRVGYEAPGAEPAFVCVSAAKFKKLSVGDAISVLVTESTSFPQL